MLKIDFVFVFYFFQPGQKPLILRTIIANYPNTKEGEEAPKRSSAPQKPGSIKPKDLSLKGKRKDLSLSMRQMIETEQSTAVNLYKEMKKKQRAQNKT